MKIALIFLLGCLAVAVYGNSIRELSFICVATLVAKKFNIIHLYAMNAR